MKTINLSKVAHHAYLIAKQAVSGDTKTRSYATVENSIDVRIKRSRLNSNEWLYETFINERYAGNMSGLIDMWAWMLEKEVSPELASEHYNVMQGCAGHPCPEIPAERLS